MKSKSIVSFCFIILENYFEDNTCYDYAINDDEDDDDLDETNESFEGYKYSLAIFNFIFLLDL